MRILHRACVCDVWRGSSESSAQQRGSGGPSLTALLLRQGLRMLGCTVSPLRYLGKWNGGCLVPTDYLLRAQDAIAADLVEVPEDRAPQGRGRLVQYAIQRLRTVRGFACAQDDS